MNKRLLLFALAFIIYAGISGVIYSQCDCLKDIINKKEPEFVSAQVYLEKVFNSGNFTEGPAYSPSGKVYFSDLIFNPRADDPIGRIYMYDPQTNETEIFLKPSGMSNGLAFDRGGNLIVCEGADKGGRRISKINLADKNAEVVTDSYNEKKYNSPNDICIDADGSIYFTDPRYSGDEPVEQDANGVYKILNGGEVIRIISNIYMPNGICISPDGKTLYVGSNDESRSEYTEENGLWKGSFIAVYDIISEREVKFKRIFHEFKNGIGPDGITVDAEGNLYAAVRDESDPAIWIFRNNGESVEAIRMPEVPSNVEFGQGAEKNILYITAGQSLYKIKTRKTGFHIGD